MKANDLKNIIGAVSPERIEQHIRELEGIRHPTADPEGLLRAERYIASTFQSLDYSVLTHAFDDNGKEFHNLLATSEGQSLPEERVMIVAHYDTVATSPGADDNASGVGVLLELATMFQGIRFDRTVHYVAVNLEEAEPDRRTGTGIARGSRAFAKEARRRNWNITGVAVLEMVAYAGDATPQGSPDRFPVSLPAIGNFLGVVGNDASSTLVEGLINSVTNHGIPLPMVPFVVPGRGNSFPAIRRSDHASFWDYDIPAIMLTDTAEFRNPHYHRSTDTIETLNIPFAARVCQALAGWVAEIGGMTSLL